MLTIMKYGCKMKAQTKSSISSHAVYISMGNLMLLLRICNNTGLDEQKFQSKIVNIFLPIFLSKCFGCSKESSH